MPPAPREPSDAHGGRIRPNQGRCHPNPTFLITGFGPFPGVPVNPSETLARRVAGAGGWTRLGWARLGWRAEVRAFRTGYGIVNTAIDDLAATNPAPAFVVMLGVAARAKWMRVELRAKNRVSVTHRDATSARPASACLMPGAETTRLGRHPGPVLVEALRKAGVPARVSRDTGRYVCNAAYWRMLGAMPKASEVVFIHIPLPAKHGIRKRDPRPTMDAMTDGITAVVRAMIVRARISGR